MDYEEFLAFAIINIGIQTTSTKLAQAFLFVSFFVCLLYFYYGNLTVHFVSS